MSHFHEISCNAKQQFRMRRVIIVMKKVKEVKGVEEVNEVKKLWKK